MSNCLLLSFKCGANASSSEFTEDYFENRPTITFYKHLIAMLSDGEVFVLRKQFAV